MTETEYRDLRDLTTIRHARDLLRDVPVQQEHVHQTNPSEYGDVMSILDKWMQRLHAVTPLNRAIK